MVAISQITEDLHPQGLMVVLPNHMGADTVALPLLKDTAVTREAISKGHPPIRVVVSASVNYSGCHKRLNFLVLGWFGSHQQQPQQPQVVYQQAPPAPQKSGMGIGTMVAAGM